MKKILVSVAGGGAALAFMFGATANANPYDSYAGRTYAQVLEARGGDASSIKIASRVGEYLPTDQCVVTGSRRISSGVAVDLNCNDQMGAVRPGYSLASPEGQKVNQLKRVIAFIDRDFAAKTAKGEAPWCEKDYVACKQKCEEAGTCSKELSDYLGL